MVSNLIPLGIHGHTATPFDSTDLPAIFWKKVVRHGASDCWLWGGGNPGTTRRAVVARLLGVSPRGLGHAEPTCGNLACVNPQHICLSLKKEP